jgi:dCMP deaminase
VRQSWNEYFIGLAFKVAERGTCDRAHVGCVLTKDNRILATGYNGALSGQPHCDEIGHTMLNNHCVKTNHAEIACIAHAARYGISIDQAICYCTHLPCLNCLKALIACGVKKIYYSNEYRKEDIPKEFLEIVSIVKI